MKKNIIYTLITLFPILDLITSIQTRFYYSLTIGIIVKGIILVILSYYLIFKSESKYKKKSLILLGIIFLYAIGYFAFKPDLLSSFDIFKNELIYIFKIVFLPIVFIGLVNYFEEHGFDKNKFIKSMKITLIEYVLLLLIPLLTGTAFDSYVTNLHGYVGWFYSANEVSIIVVMLLPFLYYFLNEEKKWNFVIGLPVIYALSCIGTKATLVGTVSVTSIYFITILIKNKFKPNNIVIGSAAILAMVGIFFFGLKPYTVNNMMQAASEQEFVFIETKPRKAGSKKKNPVRTVHYNKLLSFLLSNRDNYFLQTKDIYDSTFTYDYLITGMGFSNTSRIDNPNISKTIEIDYLDLYYHAGIGGLLITLTPIIYVLGFLIKDFFTNKRKLFVIFHGAVICMILCCAGFAGHVLYYPSSSLYLILLMIFTIDKKYEHEELDYNKVQILALHLKQGGIETVLTNQANMLSKKYNIEIVSLYNNHEEIPYELNDNIKVTYLLNTISNKEIIKTLFSEKKYFKAIPEIFKAIKILYLKNRVLQRFIVSSNAGTIISTRCEFGKILGNYHRNGVVTITEEHVYHKNNPKLIKETINNCKNIDYLLPTSKELVDFFTPKVKADVRYIKNVIKYYPEELNKLSNKKLLAIGRLSTEKGFIDLIPIMKEVVKKNKSVVLDIYGDGPEKENIINAIKKNKLEKNINLKGFISYNKLNEVRKDYSLMVIPSYEESFGLAALETMAFGIPCIMYDDAKGLQEFINSDNGIIISKRNKKEFASSILDLLKNKKKLLELGANARNKSLEYAYDKVQNEFIEFIDEAIKNNKSKHRKVMFISSTGGHFNELSQLKSMFKKYDYEIVTEKTKTNSNLKKKYNGKLHYLLYGTRFHALPYFLFILPANCFISLFYYIKYRPEFIITTGAHTAGPMCCIGKIFGSRIIYIESFANSKTKTATGKIIYKFADLFIVQWEDMTKLYPDATFGGWIY